MTDNPTPLEAALMLHDQLAIIDDICDQAKIPRKNNVDGREIPTASRVAMLAAQKKGESNGA